MFALSIVSGVILIYLLFRNIHVGKKDVHWRKEDTGR